jgi:hypothetical protein
MFGPPRHSPITIQELPYELLLQIGAHFTHLDRNWDLAQLALVSKVWREVAQVWLLKAPRFSLTYIDKYLWELGHHEHLQPQVKTIEIWSRSANRIPKDQIGTQRFGYVATPAPPNWNSDFLPTCKKIINTTNSESKTQWEKALHEDCISALFGVLLCTLPNLRELRLSNAWLMDFSIFWSLQSPYVASSSTFVPSAWKNQFLEEALAGLLPKLEILEVPADMSRLYFHRTPTILDFRRFASLKEVGITMKALWWHPSLTRNPPPDPREVFPPTLELLRISEAGLSKHVMALVQNMRLAKSGGHFPALRRIEVYFMEALELDWDDEDGDTCERFYRRFYDAGFAVYLLWPAYELKIWEVEETPWRLKEDHERYERAQRKVFRNAMGAFGVESGWTQTVEAEWDEDGDIVM